MLQRLKSKMKGETYRPWDKRIYMSFYVGHIVCFGSVLTWYLWSTSI